MVGNELLRQEYVHYQRERRKEILGKSDDEEVSIVIKRTTFLKFNWHDSTFYMSISEWIDKKKIYKNYILKIKTISAICYIGVTNLHH